ncbi:MAG: hypothetical protein Q9225_001195 [Loekoesia sp. 1 TL-2023]
MAEVVYTGVTDAAGVQGQLFQGVKFWLSQKVPQRKRFIEEVKANGGEITPLEKEADVKIVDHARKEQLPGTYVDDSQYSYQYIEFSVRYGALEDLERHAVGPPIGTVRTVGSTLQPPKSARTKFTPEDDRVLVNWVHGIEQGGGATSGNEIYKQLEAKVRRYLISGTFKPSKSLALQNPRHTWQSWRDRWVKTLKNLPRSAFISEKAPPTPPAEQIAEANEPPRPWETAHKPFSKDDAEDLLKVGDDIMNILPDRLGEAWSKWVDGRDNPKDHTAQEWQDFWEKSIRPIYLKRKAKAAKGSPGARRVLKSTAEVDEQVAQHQPTSLAVRISPSKEDLKERTAPRSHSYRLESPTNGSRTISPEQTTTDRVDGFIDGASDQRHVAGSPGKRKRPDSEEVEEVPSSSPPEPVRCTKRLRPDEEESLFIEIGSTSEQDRIKKLPAEIPDTLATNIPGEENVVDLIDDKDSPEPSDEDEDYYSEKSHSLSPELGRSPAKSANHAQRNVSKTQGIFDEPEEPIDFDLPPPDGGFGDENEDKHDGRGTDDNGKQGDGSEEDDEEAEEFHSLDDEQPRNTVKEHLLPPDSDPESNLPSSLPGRSPRPHQPTTQALLATETQLPDLSLPAPEGGWDAALLPSSPPEFPPSSQPDSHQQQRDQPSQTDHQQHARSPSPNPADQLDQFIDHHLSLGYTEDSIHLALECTNMDPVLSVRVLEAMRRNGEKVPADMKGCWTEEDDRDLESVDARRIKRVEEKHGKEGVGSRWAFLEEYRR